MRSKNTTAPRIRGTLAERFWPKVDVLGPDECWLWKAYIHDPSGYGQLSGDAGSSVYSHRAAYELFYGPIPNGLSVLHSCDNKPCCNPRHLRAGTQKDNLQDRFDRNRHWRKISDLDIPVLVRMRHEGKLLQEIADHFHVTKTTIWRIVRGFSTWGPVMEMPPA